MSGQTNIIYLHGFASGTGSTKARFFKTKFEQAGIEVALPDLNVPTFEKMTLSAQLQKVKDEAQCFGKDRPVTLMGSSLGGLLAAIACERLSDCPIIRLILMAPAFGIAARWREHIGEEAMSEWQRSGNKSFFHYACGKDLNLAYSFIQDLEQYKTDGLKVNVPTLIFHGVNDASVPINQSREFCRLNSPLAQLNELEDGHELTASMAAMWQGIERFLHASETI